MLGQLNGFTYEIVSYEPIIPTEVPKLYFKFKLLELGIKNSDIDILINTMSDGVEKEKIKLMWYESNVIERKNNYIYDLLPTLNGILNLNITNDDILNIFKKYDKQ